MFHLGMNINMNSLLFSARIRSVVGFCINCHMLQIEPTQMRIMIQFIDG